MSILKSRISSPLEAGSSLLDAAQLPPQLMAALEYVSERLARKGLHLSLVVVRSDVQMPCVLSSPPSPTQDTTSSATPSAASASPTRTLFSAAATNITKALSRHSSRASLASETGSAVSKSSSETSRTSSRASLSRTTWGSLPGSPRDGRVSPSISSTPSSCSSASSSPSPTPELRTGSNPYAITLLHASTLTARAERILRYVVGRAERKFGIGSGYLVPASNIKREMDTQTHDLIQRSLLQDSILFTSTGLTLLALDHLYTFKCHLHTYSRSLSASDFTIAVDELQRLVLARQSPQPFNPVPSPLQSTNLNPNPNPEIETKPSHKAKITRSELIRTYDWLGVSLAALVDVDEGYKVAYGGKQRDGAMEEEKRRMVREPLGIETSFARRMVDVRRLKLRSSSVCDCEEEEDVGVGDGTGGEGRGEVAFGESVKGIELDDDDDGGGGIGKKKNEKEKGEVSGMRVRVGVGVEDGAQIERLKPDRGPHRRGAATPNGFEDITPVTRGSWCFLMVGEGWKEGRRVGVETC